MLRFLTLTDHPPPLRMDNLLQVSSCNSTQRSRPLCPEHNCLCLFQSVLSLLQAGLPRHVTDMFCGCHQQLQLHYNCHHMPHIKASWAFIYCKVTMEEDSSWLIIQTLWSGRGPEFLPLQFHYLPCPAC